MGWKPAQYGDRHDESQPSQEQGENVWPQEEHIRRLNNNKRRNALTVCSLREDILRQLGVQHSRDNHEWRGNVVETNPAS